MLLMGSCRIPEPGSSRKEVPDLLQEARRQEAGEAGQAGRTHFLFPFSRDGIRREALVLTPGAVWEANPQSLSASSPLRIWVGMPFQIGDGAELSVETVRAGQPGGMIRMPLNPVHNRGDRQWHLLQMPFAPDTTLIRFRVSAGPSGDSTGDWVGLAPWLP